MASRPLDTYPKEGWMMPGGNSRYFHYYKAQTGDMVAVCYKVAAVALECRRTVVNDLADYRNRQMKCKTCAARLREQSVALEWFGGEPWWA